MTQTWMLKIPTLQLKSLLITRSKTEMFFFSSFEMYDNTHQVSSNAMKDIATFAKKSLDISQLICLQGLSFSRVTQKTEWMNRTAGNINLLTSPSCLEDFLKISESSNVCFVPAMEIDCSNWDVDNSLLIRKRVM